jgi:peptidyl-prolyl cis-trans isomerase SurA
MIPAILLSLAQGAPASAPASFPAPSLPAVPEVDRVVAIVNDDVITQSELEAQMATVLATLGNPSTLDLPRLRREQLRAMAHDRLFTQAARRLNLDEKRIDERVKQRIEDLEKKAGGHSQLLKNIEAQGKSFAEFEREERSRELVEVLQRTELGLGERSENDISLSPLALRAHYREHVADYTRPPAVQGREILLPERRFGSKEAALAKARELRAELVAGADFAKLASQHSDWKPAEGGALSWIELGSGFDPRIERALFSLEPEGVSAPIELEGAVAIVRVDAKRPGGLRPFEDPETQRLIADDLVQRRAIEVLRKLRARLLSESYVWPADLLGR